MFTPMIPEYCATCGCGELDHIHREGECDDDCPPDCTGPHEDTVECECGSCNDYVWTSEEAQDLVCLCGCLEYEHVDAEGACDACGECDGFEEWGTALDRLRGELWDRGRGWPEPRPGPPPPPGMLRLDWFDEPVEIVGALIAAPNGDAVRVQGPPPDGTSVYLYFAVTQDGLEIAVSRDEL